MNLSRFGWQYYLSQTKQSPPNKLVARITAEHKTSWVMTSESGELIGIVMNSFRQALSPEKLPKIGDFVCYEPLASEAKGKIIKVLPRYSQLTRRLTEQRNKLQVIASNVDTMFIVTGLDQTFSLDQLRRYLAMSTQEHISSVLVINKTDLGSGAQQLEIQVRELFPDLPIVHTSAETKIGLSKLTHYMQPAQTVIFIGSSGAGKSSLINALLAENVQSTKSVRSDGKGRHTTSRREMFLLPSGTIVIDSPGIRTLEVDVEADNLPADSQLAKLAQQCQFRNCDHINSKGCKLIEALANNKITQSAYQNYLKLIRDAERSQSLAPHQRQKLRIKQKAQHKALRQAYQTRKPPKK
ncbi:MAG TPA: ribosome small subunit-dependent GTPase A [Candidatus Doudnabacteria bacterium]|nr:ribosome small subunit-dependent GTPase A [Candidatus Doudnabacteria bacterium]